MLRARTSLLILGAAALTAFVARHLRHGPGHHHEGGVLVGDAGAYDRVTRILFGTFYRGVADDVAASAPSGGQVLEVGCGPGQLALGLARRGLDVTGLDLDPAMIERARENAGRHAADLPAVPRFDVGDVAALPYSDDSFDLVASTLALHHWADPAAAMSEIARVLRPEGTALIWDFSPGRQPLHGHLSDQTTHLHDSSLQMTGTTPWRWPLRLSPIRRMEFTQGA